jgi:chromosome partitioning protein
MAKKRTYANQKGGVTKTTTVVQDMIQSRLLGKRALLVDTDPQGNATYALGYHPDTLKHTVYTVMLGQSSLNDALLHTYFDPQTGTYFDPRNTRRMQELGITSLEQARRGPDLLPNNILAATAETDLQSHPSWGTVLRDILEDIDALYDDIGIDTNPSLGKMTVSAFCAADYAIIPLVPETLPSQGMIQLCKTFVEARKYNRKLRMAGVLFTRVRYSSHEETIRDIRGPVLQHLNTRQDLPDLNLSCFEATIPENALFEKAIKDRTSIILANSISAPAIAYWQFYTELMKSIDGLGYEKAQQMYLQLQKGFQKQQEEEKAKKRRGRTVKPSIESKGE